MFVIVFYQVPFYLWRIDPVLKRCKVPLYYDHRRDAVRYTFGLGLLLET